MSKEIILWCVLSGLLLTDCLPTQQAVSEKKDDAQAAAQATAAAAAAASSANVPKVTYSKKTELDAGEQFLINCEVQGIDLSQVKNFQIKWSKVTLKGEEEQIVPISANKQLLIFSDKFEVVHPENTYQYSLKVVKANEDDTGTYRCTVDFGEDQKVDADVPVLVRKPAYFADDSIKTIRVTEGDAISIDCQPGGSPSPEVYWERENEDIPYYGGQLIKTNKFDLPLVDRTHTGKYKCYADNGLAEPVVSKVVLEVDYQPSAQPAEAEIVASAYDTIHLQCQGEGSPTPEFAWLKNGEILSNSVNHRIKSERDTNTGKVTTRLTISEAQVEDFGQYTCAAANSLATNVADITLSLKSPPMIQKQTRGEKIYELVPAYGKARDELPIALECEASGSPRPTYRWTKDGDNLLWETDPRMSLEFGTGTLLIRHPEQKDNGLYQCFAFNELGMAASEPIKLANSSSIQFTRKEKDENYYEAELGRPFRLACPEATGHPKPSLTWMKSRLLTEGIEMEYITSDRMILDDIGTLWITHVTQEDDTELNGFEFVCLASTELHPYDISLAKSVKLKTIPPQDGQFNIDNEHVNVESFAMYTSPEVVTFKTGEENNLWCIFGGEPIPDVSWSRTDGKDFDFTRFYVKNNGQTLVIKDTQLEDGGEYQCVATNRVGSPKFHTISVAINLVPKFEQELSEQAQVVHEGTTVTFACSIKGAEKSSLVDYQWFYNSRPIELGIAGSRRQVDGPHLTIDSVKTADIGNYACKAFNEAGQAYGQTTLNVIPKSAPSSKVDGSPESVQALRDDLNTLKTDVQKLSELIETKLSQPPPNPKLDSILSQLTALLGKQDTTPADQPPVASSKE